MLNNTFINSFGRVYRTIDKNINESSTSKRQYGSIDKEAITSKLYGIYGFDKIPQIIKCNKAGSRDTHRPIRFIIIFNIFSATYAKLCKLISSTTNENDANLKVPQFRKILLDRCEKEFMKHTSAELNFSKKIADLPDTLTDLERNKEIKKLQYILSNLENKALGKLLAYCLLYWHSLLN